jgi:hypothetical protein
MRIRSTERFGDLPASRVSSTSANLGDITIRDSEIIVGEDKTLQFYSNNGSSNVNIGSIGSTGFRPAVVTDSTLPTPEAGGEGLMVYNTTSKTYEVWNGTSWESDNQDTAIASEVLPTGHTVVINPNGTVGLIAPISVGTQTPYSGANAVTAMTATFDSNSNRVVIAYKDVGNSDRGTAIVGTVSGTTISFGTAILFEATGAADFMSATFDSNSNKVVIAYRYGSTLFGSAVVGTVDGSNNSISFGPTAVFQNSRSDHISATFDSNSNKVVIAYQNDGNGDRGTAIVGTVDGETIMFPTAAVLFDNTRADNISISFDSNSNKVVIAYIDLDNTNYGTAVVGTVGGGNSITFGPPSVFESTNSSSIYSVFDSGVNKVVIAYQNVSDGSGYGVVGTVSGTSISFGTPTKFNLALTTMVGIAFDSTANKVVISYKDGATGHGTAIAGWVSGTSILYGDPLVFNPSNTIGAGDATVFDSLSNKVVVSYRNSSVLGDTVVFNSWNPLTTDNFLGFSNNNYATGSTANIQTVGSVNNDQIGLTSGRKYYVQLDGTIGVTAASPSVYAGLALTDTKIVVKG